MLRSGNVHVYVPVNPSHKDILHQQCMDILNDFFIQKLLLCDTLLHIAVCLLVVDGLINLPQPLSAYGNPIL